MKEKKVKREKRMERRKFMTMMINYSLVIRKGRESEKQSMNSSHIYNIWCKAKKD